MSRPGAPMMVWVRQELMNFSVRTQPDSQNSLLLPHQLIFQGPAYLSVRLALFDRLALVKALLAVADANFQFKLSPSIIHRNSDYCQAFLALNFRQVFQFFFSK